MLKRIFFSLLIIFLFVTPVSGVGYFGNGVDDLRGRWDVNLFFGEGDEEGYLEVRWLIQDIEPHPDEENMFLATGCMQTIATGGSAPLSLVATNIPEENRYEFTLYSTIIPVDGEPFVIRFDGEVIVNGEGVTDDESQGYHISERGEGPWEADHHDRRRPYCSETIDPSLQFEGDVFVHQDLALPTPRYMKLFSGWTKIVSSGLRVEAPDGEIFDIPFYTDIFSPFVDFINEFRYLSSFEGPPIVGQAYIFTLLDILGNPIAGAMAEDLWTGCTQSAPENIALPETIVGVDIDMSWDPVEDAPGWDPDGEPRVGFYQIGISPNFEAETSYGANDISTPEHLIPWDDFDPQTPGTPNGLNYGDSLSELVDGDYDILLEAYSEALHELGGLGLECSVFDSNQSFQMQKIGEELTFTRVGTIAGHVTNESGEPLAGVWVDACEYSNEPQFCRSNETDSNGNYLITGLLPGDYQVQAGNESYAREFYDDTYQWEEATAVNVNSGATSTGIDFELVQGGSISGRVTNLGGDPLPGIEVGACDFNDEPYCQGAQTDEDGNYIINGLLPGEYRVNAGNENYAGEFFDDTYLWEEATPVPVNAGETTQGIDFELSQAGSISGTVFDEYGVALSNIAVDIEEGGYGTCTDENGNYTMSGLPLGSYTVVAGRDFCSPHDYLEERIEDIELTDETHDVGDVDFYLTQGGSIAGTVTDTLGDPIVGIHVEACEFNDDPQFCRGAETDEAGNYRISGLISTDFRVWTGNEIYSQEFFDDVYEWHLATPVWVDPGLTTLGIDFELAQAGSISGTVFDESGVTLSNIAVDIEEGGFGACTDEEGNYTLSGLPLGTYTVVAGRDFCGPHDYIEEKIEGVELTDVTPDVGGVDFNLTQGGSISGIVTDSDGPLAGAHVEACEYSDDPLFCRGAETDESGNYLITGLLPLEIGYRVWADKEGYIQELYDETNNWGLATAVLVVAGEITPNIDFTLDEGGSIAGTVTDTIGAPIEGIQVVACEYDVGFCMDAFSDSEGNYTITGLPVNDYRVQSGSEWYVTEFFNETYDWGEAERVSVVAGGTTDGINFTLEKGGSIAGRVKDDGDSPIEGVIVIACEYDGGYCMDATSAVDGTYRIYAIPASDYRVEAHGEGFVIFFPGTVDPDSATPVPVVANVITENIDFKLTPD